MIKAWSLFFFSVDLVKFVFVPLPLEMGGCFSCFSVLLAVYFDYSASVLHNATCSGKVLQLTQPGGKPDHSW